MSTRRLALWIGLPLLWAILGAMFGIVLARPPARIHASAKTTPVRVNDGPQAFVPRTEPMEAPLIAVTPDQSPVAETFDHAARSVAVAHQPLIEIARTRSEPSQPTVRQERPRRHRRRPVEIGADPELPRAPEPATAPLTQRPESIDEPEAAAAAELPPPNARHTAVGVSRRQRAEPIGRAPGRERRIAAAARRQSVPTRLAALRTAAKRDRVLQPGFGPDQQRREALNWRSRFFADSDFRDERWR